MTSARLRYEVGVSLGTGDIVQVNGPCPCGCYPDLTIFREDKKTTLNENKWIIAGLIYNDNKCITPDTIVSPIPIKIHREPRARHETANKHSKQFYVLRSQFRHPIEFDGVCFHAI